MIKFCRAAIAGLVALAVTALFAAQAQAVPTDRSAAVPRQGPGDLVFAGIVGLLFLGAAVGVIVYVARHRNVGG
ncbi:MAG: hypothetical protein JOZ47_12750 [Kutzneria sp.]|nr:hypothetical protein [Kutzneria sp.]